MSLVLLLVAASACGSSDTQATTAVAAATTVINNDAGIVTATAQVPPAGLVPAGVELQEELLADGRVTRPEFERAVAGMAACMRARGLTGVRWSVDPVGNEWSSGHDATGDEAGDAAIADLCFFSYVDRVYRVFSERD